MKTTKIHYSSGLVIALFIVVHLFNHLCSLLGADKHIEMMNYFRLYYRNPFAEVILLVAVVVQIISGLRLVKHNWNNEVTGFEKLQRWTGLYLAFFFIIHLGAVLVGRIYLHLDTNFYFGVAGLNSFPVNLFFIPYYALAILSFVGHLASIHNKKMRHTFWGLTPTKQAKAILLIGILLTIVLFYGLTNRFDGVQIPAVYNVLIGK